MKSSKLQQLFNQARKETPPCLGADLESRVISEIRKECRPVRVTVFDQLNEMFPRFALAAVVLIVICAVGDFWLSSGDEQDMTSGLAQASQDWQFVTKGFEP
jgi:hypothetical protein